MTEPLDLKKLREIRDAATPGPWNSGTRTSGRGLSIHISPTNGCKSIAFTGNHFVRGQIPDMFLQEDFDKIKADSKYIATFDPEMIKSLLDRIEELEEKASKAGTHDHCLQHCPDPVGLCGEPHFNREPCDVCAEDPTAYEREMAGNTPVVRVSIDRAEDGYSQHCSYHCPRTKCMLRHHTTHSTKCTSRDHKRADD